MKGDYKHIYFIIGIVLFFIIILAARFYIESLEPDQYPCRLRLLPDPELLDK